MTTTAKAAIVNGFLAINSSSTNPLAIFSMRDHLQAPCGFAMTSQRAPIACPPPPGEGASPGADWTSAVRGLDDLIGLIDDQPADAVDFGP
jgi:hypothetical protein